MSKRRNDSAARSPTFIFFIEEVWRFSTDGELAVSGRMVEGRMSGPCRGQVRLTDATTLDIDVLGLARTRTSRLGRTLTLRVTVAPGDERKLQGGYLMGDGKEASV